MGRTRVRRTRLSPVASVIMIVLGVLTFLFVNSLAGIILTVLGVVMYAISRGLSGRRQPSEPSEVAQS